MIFDSKPECQARRGQALPSSQWRTSVVLKQASGVELSSMNHHDGEGNLVDVLGGKQGKLKEKR